MNRPHGSEVLQVSLDILRVAFVYDISVYKHELSSALCIIAMVVKNLAKLLQFGLGYLQLCHLKLFQVIRIIPSNVVMCRMVYLVVTVCFMKCNSYHILVDVF